MTIERVVRFIDLLSYRETTLKSDTVPAIVAFKNRQSGSRHRRRNEGRQRIEWARRECGDAVARNHPQKCHIESRTQ